MNKFIPLIFCVVLLGLVGCEKKETLGAVRGTVTFNGAPVREGMVTFSAKDKGVSITAPLDADGKYAVAMAQGAGLPPGTYTVTVTPPIPQIETGKPLPPPKKYDNIPMKYRDEKSSDLHVEVVAAGVEFNIDLKP